MSRIEKKTAEPQDFSSEEQDLIDAVVKESDRAKSEEKEALGVELPRPAASREVKIPRHQLPPNFDKNLTELKATMNKMDKRLKPVRSSNRKPQVVLASVERRSLQTGEILGLKNLPDNGPETRMSPIAHEVPDLSKPDAGADDETPLAVREAIDRARKVVGRPSSEKTDPQLRSLNLRGEMDQLRSFVDQVDAHQGVAVPEEDQFPKKFKPAPIRPPRKPYFSNQPRPAEDFVGQPPEQVVPEPNDSERIRAIIEVLNGRLAEMAALDAQISGAQKQLEYEQNTRAILGMGEDEVNELRDRKNKLQARIDEARETVNTLRRESVVELAPIVQPDPDLESPTVTLRAEVAPNPEPAVVESREPKSVKEILLLQEDALVAYKAFRTVRGNKKILDLPPEEQSRYKELRTIAQAKREVWLAELDKLPEEQQDELEDVTRLQEVRDRLATLSTEQIVAQALEGTLEAYKQELATLELEIQEMERLIKYDQEIGDSKVHNIAAQGNEDDLKSLKARRRALMAKIASMSAGQTPTPISPEPVAPTPEPAGPKTHAPEVIPTVPPAKAETVPQPKFDHERARAEFKARRLELLRESVNALNAKITEKIDEHAHTSQWSGVMDRMRINGEIKALRAERVRLDREMNERQGFGAKFKESALKAYRAVKSRLKFERSKPITLGLSEVPEATAPSIDDIARVEAEVAGAPTEQVEETGTWGKWLKQRLIGVGSVGWTEFSPAQQFRKGTRGVAEDLGSMSRTIEPERDLSQETAHEEANRIMAKIKAEGGESAGDPRFMEISSEITEQRIARNNAKIDEIVLAQMAELEQKLKGYKGDFGQDILTAENKGKIATEMRARLVAMRSGEAELDVKGMTTELRKGLDRRFWRRYVYAGFDAVLGGLALKAFGGWLLSSKAKEVVLAKGAAIATKESGLVGLKTTIWAEAKSQLIAHGVANPTNGQILQVATKFCVDSGVKVMANGQLIWAKTVAGKAVDTALAKGFMIHEAGGLKLIAGMVAGA